MFSRNTAALTDPSVLLGSSLTRPSCVAVAAALVLIPGCEKKAEPPGEGLAQHSFSQTPAPIRIRKDFDSLKVELAAKFTIHSSKKLGPAVAVILPDVHREDFEAINAERLTFLLTSCGADTALIEGYLQGPGTKADQDAIAALATSRQSSSGNLLGPAEPFEVRKRVYEQFFGSSQWSAIGFETDSSEWILNNHASLIAQKIASMLQSAAGGRPPIIKFGDKYDPGYWALAQAVAHVRKNDPTFPDIAESEFDVGKQGGQTALYVGNKAQVYLATQGNGFAEWLNRQNSKRNQAALNRLSETIASGDDRTVGIVVGANHMSPALGSGALEAQLESKGFSWILLDLPQPSMKPQPGGR